MYLKPSNLSKTHLKMGKFPQKETSTAVRSIPYAYYIIFAGALAVSLRQGMESWFWEKNEKIPSNHTIHEWYIFTHIYHKKSTIHVCINIRTSPVDLSWVRSTWISEPGDLPICGAPPHAFSNFGLWKPKPESTGGTKKNFREIFAYVNCCGLRRICCFFSSEDRWLFGLRRRWKNLGEDLFPFGSFHSE